MNSLHTCRTPGLRPIDGVLPSTGLRVGASAPTVLMPGDPHRSKRISELFRDAAFTAHRGTYATYTGHTPGGEPIAVTSSGMGCACVATALEELRDGHSRRHLRRCAAVDAARPHCDRLGLRARRGREL